MPKPTPILDRLEKCPTGIQGFDEITGGGLPAGRPTLVAGSAGCGKSLLAMEFLARGAAVYREPGVFVSFEEKSQDLLQNFASLDFNLRKLMSRRLLMLDHVYIERSEIEETGQYDLEGLFVRLNHAIDSIKAKRVVLDTIEALFAGFDNQAILRAELRRLFRWLKDKGVTAVITGERGGQTLTRYGLEEYVADCVILLDHRMQEQVATRRLRVLKYRGTAHGTNEYPFLISPRGITVIPITSNLLNHRVSRERITSGVPEMDLCLGGQGFYRGSTILISGTAGTGKTSFAATLAQATCSRGERCQFFAFEESPDQILRNMRSIGLNLAPVMKSGLLRIEANRPTLLGLEMHLSEIQHQIESFQPTVVIVDPISNLTSAGAASEVTALLARLIDYLKTRGITLLMTNLTSDVQRQEETELGVSSLVDSWLLLQTITQNQKRDRYFSILKSRGTDHSPRQLPFEMSDRGIHING